MAPTANVFRASRPLFRQQFAAGQTRYAFTRATGFRSSFRQGAGRRFQSTTADGAAAPQQQASWVKRMWDSPVGLKTVHFWAPVMKWALVLAGVADFARPAEKLSLTQNAALTATGLIWTRWCLIIKPKNYLLAAVNFFLGIVGIVQVTRIAMWQSSQKKTQLPAAEDVKEEAKEVIKA
ncbi:hypothetical protein NKR23_g1810 [Pleurostoma richardsiae]|uniref:Mitochondrial pyruvate carrier n=1 Tax=Pleurostoma richardsiae TaxID=41990 RepID=A0AA38S9T6_9PEZI|nr:hypothetical protein NKR23_g1810 [Pleurostoma richardsiae]